MQAKFEKIPIAPDSSFAMFVRRDRGFSFSWHYHPEYELTLIVRSRGQRFVGDNIAAYRDGDLVLLGPNLPHTWSSAGKGGDHHAIVVQFHADFLGRSLWERPEFTGIADLLRRGQRGLQFTGAVRAAVAGQMLQLPRQRGLARLQTLLTILDRLARVRTAQTLSSSGFTPSLRYGDQTRIDRVCQYIHAHLREPLDMPTLARQASLSPEGFGRFFKRTLGKSPSEYINELRIGHACSLLVQTDKTVTEVCFESGFNNLAYFNRRFLALKNVTPRHYRRAYERGGPR